MAAKCEAGILESIVKLEFVVSGTFLLEPRSEFLLGPIAACYQKDAVRLEQRQDAVTVQLTYATARGVGF